MHHMKETSSALILLLTALIWGSTFVFQSEASSSVGPLCYNGLRMLLGFIVLLPLLIRSIKGKSGKEMKMLLKDGFVCGVLLFSASFFQQYGIEFTTAGKAGFITSLYILIVPVISLVFGKRNTLKTWLCVAAGLIGAFLLSINGREGLGKGDALIFICAVLFSLHVMFIDHVSHRYRGVELSAVQFFFAGAIACILSLIFEKNTTGGIREALVPILYGGIGSCGIAYTLQIIGQKNMNATKATLILSLESVFSAVGGALILKETMTAKEITGAVILFLSVVCAELPERKKITPSSR